MLVVACLSLFGGHGGGHTTSAPQLPNQRAPRSAIQGRVTDERGRGIPGATVVLTRGTREVERTIATADGVFRFFDIPPGQFTISITKQGYEPVTRGDLTISGTELVTIDLKMVPLPAAAPKPPVEPAPTPYGRLPGRREEPPQASAPLPAGEKIFLPVPDRWNLPLPDWDRYGSRGDYPYVSGHWWDPYNQNVLKGDYPVLGQRTFFVFTGVSDSLLEGRNLPTPSGISAARPNSEPFFGRGGQFQPVTAIRTSFDLFRGDTAFRPVDWRVRVAPAFSANFVNTAEFGIVNADVRRQSNRFDAHLGLQEAFVEKKLHDLGPSYDFVSVRAGIQELSSDFRGFVSVIEAPGVRIFGTLRSSRIEYNAAAFDLLEKDTNSGFNELDRRHQQVYIANVYIQDFLTPGYTASFSFHANDDRGPTHYDTNGFLVRPAPIGLIVPNRMRAYYAGWAGNGHVGRFNISHAFYQAFGHEDANPIAAQRVRVNSQMAALELSLDRDWIRFKGSTFFASGDDDPSDDRGRGFDAIVDIPVFAGGPFSLWNRQGLRLPQTGTGLVSPVSLLPSLRTNKDEGQSNFVNPGIFLINGGTDLELTPKLRGFVTASYLRFVTTEPLETLLFQQPIRPGIGFEYGGGASYRPPLTDNVVIVGGVAAMTLGQGLKDIYDRDHFFSMFVNARLQF
jgi:hypothetical protein